MWKAWQSWEEQYIIDNYKPGRSKELQNKLDRSIAAIDGRIIRLKRQGSIKYEVGPNNEEKAAKAAKAIAEKERIESKKAYNKEKKKQDQADKQKKDTQRMIAKKKAERIKLEQQYHEAIKADAQERYKNGVASRNMDIEIDPEKTYNIRFNNDKTIIEFEGKLFGKYKDHITFIDKNNIRESFLCKDFMIGEYKIKAV